MILHGGILLEKHFKYRKHLRYIQYIVPSILGILIILIWGTLGILNAIYYLYENFPELYMLAGVLSIIFLIEGLFSFFFLRRFNRVEIVLNDESIIYKNIRGETIIPIGEIKKLEFPSIKYAGGWVKIISHNTNIRLTVVVEEIGDFLKSLKNNLDSRGMESVYNSKKFYSFYKTAEFSDQSWGRMYDLFPKGCLAVLVNLSVAVIASIYGDFNGGVIILLVTASLIGPLMVYIIGEIIIGRKITREANEEEFSVPQRDKYLENKVYIISGAIYAIGYLLVVVLLMF